MLYLQVPIAKGSGNPWSLQQEPNYAKVSYITTKIRYSLPQKVPLLLILCYYVQLQCPSILCVCLPICQIGHLPVCLLFSLYLCSLSPSLMSYQLVSIACNFTSLNIKHRRTSDIYVPHMGSQVIVSLNHLYLSVASLDQITRFSSSA